MSKSSQQYWKRLWDRDFSREVDRISSENLRIPSSSLMETAGRCVAAEIKKRWSLSHPVVVLAGNGNNGGDGLVAARVLCDWGYNVQIVHVSDKFPASLSELSKLQFDIIKSLRIPLQRYAPGLLTRHVKGSTIVIDGVLGLGVRGSPRKGPVLDALQEVSQCGCHAVVAIDVPSGLDPNAVGPGYAAPPLPAQLTITFGGLHPCHVAAPSRSSCGDVQEVDIGFPRDAMLASEKTYEPMWFAGTSPPSSPFPSLGRDIHKFDRGLVLVIGGSEGKWGALSFSARAAGRCGAGWVSVAPLGESYQALDEDFTKEDLHEHGMISSEKLAALLQLRPFKAIVIGPGSSGQCLDLACMRILKDFTSNGGFVVFDAGATHDLHALLKQVPLHSENAIVTPHPGEWTKMGMPQNPGLHVKHVLQLSQDLGVTLVYKSAAPLIWSDRIGGCGICTYGDPALSKAGVGDILAGCIGALGAAGMNATDAGQRALAIIARCGKLSGLNHGMDGNFPSDFLDWLSIAQQSV